MCGIEGCEREAKLYGLCAQCYKETLRGVMNRVHEGIIAGTYSDLVKSDFLRLMTENTRLQRSEEAALGLISNSCNGDWTKESLEWREAAGRWRDKFLLR
jgi:hypothetical protein